MDNYKLMVGAGALVIGLLIIIIIAMVRGGEYDNKGDKDNEEKQT